jgi:glycosyltransferase involved in cell wall biosynthesis
MLASVIIPTHNRAKRVAEAIESVIAQTYPDIQIIVVDDGSTDNTKEIVAAFPEVEYFYQDNQRQAAARTAGLRLAKGKYIATLDSDDIWESSFLTKSIECLEKFELDFVFSSWQERKVGGLQPSAWEISKSWLRYIDYPQGDWYLLTPAMLRELFIKTCPAPSSSLVIRKSSVASDWNPALYIADDWCFVLDMIMAKECRAAFTLERLWTKKIDGKNVYHGRNRGEIAKELEIHDTRLMKRRHLAKLSLTERLVFSRRVLRGYIVRVLFFFRDQLGFRNPHKMLRSRLERFDWK